MSPQQLRISVVKKKSEGKKKLKKTIRVGKINFESGKSEQPNDVRIWHTYAWADLRLAFPLIAIFAVFKKKKIETETTLKSWRSYRQAYVRDSILSFLGCAKQKWVTNFRGFLFFMRK